MLPAEEEKLVGQTLSRDQGGQRLEVRAHLLRMEVKMWGVLTPEAHLCALSYVSCTAVLGRMQENSQKAGIH